MLRFHKNILSNKIWLNGYIAYILAFLIMIVMPVYHWFLPPIMIIWGAYFIFAVSIRTHSIKQINPHHKLLFVLFFLFFAWQLIGMLYSDNPGEGWRNIELHLSLLLFPLVLVSPGEMIRQKVGVLLKVFSLTTFFFLVICYGYALYRSLNFQNGTLIFNPYLPEYTWLNYFYALEFTIFQHTSYLSMFTLLSVFIALETFFDNQGSGNYRLFWLVIAIILLISVYFLSSRAGILAAIITVPLYLFIKFKIAGKKKFVGLAILIIIPILILVSLTNPRVNNYMEWRSERKVSSGTVVNDRFIIWDAVTTILKSNFVFGVGTGDIQDELNKEYLRNGNNKLAEVNTNAHNQYLEVILENGLIGLFLLLSIFGLMFYLSVTGKNIVFMMFILTVLISFIFETMLNRLAGVTFFSLFSFLLIHINSGIKQTK